ncbi:E3 ubiquitin-protein ligase Os04g0590900-like [Anopheles stephensi]|uniref:E3 ubiquitin-protein ligase Os04g0590900-like n=1 Tax=Anopheles stephensi TaxID=30069 RepID=UPI0007D36F2C|nr:E3 ubiquitin-protein ligase Os04g0590900-like [Anopheles stephensi]
MPSSICTICLETLESGAGVRVLRCMHPFHETCIARWLENSDRCPLCNVSHDTDHLDGTDQLLGTSTSLNEEAYTGAWNSNEDDEPRTSTSFYEEARLVALESSEESSEEDEPPRTSFYEEAYMLAWDSESSDEDDGASTMLFCIASDESSEELQFVIVLW